mmetsp:Transcript_158888/g.509552  ORF Transcript_158888/g.509552 Transcript_158888/m.509552 type:complete len:246 (-) Transcript_158888:7963-8700(-)
MQGASVARDLLENLGPQAPTDEQTVVPQLHARVRHALELLHELCVVRHDVRDVDCCPVPRGLLAVLGRDDGAAHRRDVLHDRVSLAVISVCHFHHEAGEIASLIHEALLGHQVEDVDDVLVLENGPTLEVVLLDVFHQLLEIPLVKVLPPHGVAQIRALEQRAGDHQDVRIDVVKQVVVDLGQLPRDICEPEDDLHHEVQEGRHIEMVTQNPLAMLNVVVRLAPSVAEVSHRELRLAPSCGPIPH